ncbi:MAG: hypothetical protein AB1750_10930, partial [Chloroflexota bacterium]
KKSIPWFGRNSDIYNLKGERVFFTWSRLLSFNREIYVYQAAEPRDELLYLKAGGFAGLSITYAVYDSITGGQIGAVRRNGVKSLLEDEWAFLSPDEREIGLISENDPQLARRRHILGSALPQRYTGRVGGAEVCAFDQEPSLYSARLTLRFLPESERRLDRRLGLAAAILLCLVEGKQKSLLPDF